MTTYIILSHLAPDSFDTPEEFKKLADEVARKIKEQCPGVTWKLSFLTTGEIDVVDVVEADDPKLIAKAAMIIRAHGHAVTETMVGIPWREFMDTI